MSLKPWLNPWYIPSLVRNLENDFGITPYCNKTLVFPRPSFLKNAFRNFQWVKTEDVMIARCAQPGYSNSAGDKDHGFNTKQRKFLVENNIKTIISLNSKRHKTESANRLYGMGIEYHHISVVDFQALKVEDHERINKIIAMRKTMGGFLFYCGYGEGRTGTAVAGWMVRYIITCAPNYFVNFSLKQLHQFVSLAFGVEKPDQTYSIADYMKKMATVEPAPGSMKPRPLSEVSYASFEDSNGSIYSINNPPPVPSSKPVFNQSMNTPPPVPSSKPVFNQSMNTPPPVPSSKPVFNQSMKPNVINAQSLNPIGNLGTGKQAGVGLNSKQTQTINLDSFYFNRSSLDDISV